MFHVLVKRSKENELKLAMEDYVEVEIGLPNVSVEYGVMRLFAKRSNGIDGHDDDASLKEPESFEGSVKIMCLISIPNTLKFIDLVAGHQDGLAKVQVVRRSCNSKGTTMGLFYFNSEKDADVFRKDMGSRTYDKPLCFVPVEKVSFDEGEDNVTNLVEVPMCPVCLERLDGSIAGVVLTTICKHSIHVDCFSKWQLLDPEPTCPVCRFPQFSLSRDSEDQESENLEDSCCENCGITKDLWLCMICGHIGCGRYTLGHAKDHFKESSHAYALEISSQRVWDYAGEGYVHRLLRNKIDGKILEIPDPNNLGSYGRQRSSGLDFSLPDKVSAGFLSPSSSGGLTADELKRQCEERMETMYMECTEFVTSQLEAQKQHFQMMLESSNLIEPDAEVKKLQKNFKSLQKQNVTLEKENEKLKRDLEFLRGLNNQLLMDRKTSDDKVGRIKKLEQENEELKKLAFKSIESTQKISELEAQLQDLMFYLDVQNQAKTNPELRDSQVQGIGRERKATLKDFKKKR